MKIKEIKLYGFKSFRDETKVLLDTGVTAFVGPNGSGKSNIFDALRWVFGEQSMKALRCEKIEDLIYISSETKEDANFTEVAVTIDNEDYFPQFGSEFEIKRRFYRTGESEFYLNRVKCRLQDIQALFLNSGALTYSFLELAEVERIIHGNTKEMFDDVAGILKYQERKEQTKRRLVATEQDLLRLDDIIAEMQRGLRSLKRQVRQARLYNELRTDYRDLKLYIMASEFRKALDEISTIQGQVDAKEGERQSLLHSIRQLEDEREELKKSIENAENEKKGNLARINEFIDAIEVLQSRIAEKEEEMRSNTILSERVLTSIKEKGELVNNNKRRMIEIEQERDAILSQLEDLQSRIEDVQGRIEAMNSEYFSIEKSLRENEERIAASATGVIEAQSVMAKLKYDKENKESMLSRMADEASNEQSVVDRLRYARKELEQKLEGIVEQQKETDGRLKALCQKESQLEESVSELENNLATRNDGIADCRIMIDTLSRRLQVEGKKAIKEKFGERVSGMFKESIEVRSGYESIIDVCLSDLLVFYLLKDFGPSDLANCPEGRFGFIDMTRDISPQRGAGIDGATPIRNYVKFKSAEEVLGRYLDEYFFVDDFTAARKLSEEHPELGFVTRDGCLFRNGTIVVQRGDVGFFRITQSLEEFKKKMEVLRNEALFTTQEKNRATEEIAETKKKIDDVRNELFAVNVKKSEFSLRLQEAKKEFENRELELAHIQEERSVLQNEIETINSHLEEMEKKVAQMEEEKAKTTSENESLSKNLRQLKNRIDDTVSELNGITTDKAVLAGKRDSVAQSIEQLKGEIANADSEIRNLRERSLPGKVDELTESINELKNELSQKREEKSAYEAKLPDHLLEENSKRLGLVYDQLTLKQKDHESMQDGIMQLKYQLFEKKHQRDDLIHKADEEFNVILGDYKPEEEMIDAPTRLSEVKGRLEKLGEVNPLSLQAYEEEKKRLDEFLGQRDDIIAAKKNLLKSIEELDQRARDRFNETFDLVKKEFNYVFANFFQDGEADLVLTDPENPLASKVEIVVRMLGRKLKTINQLSGGQKTLLAISLLLAFYLVKPAPFCILDEIDAPLDDINVVRFNKFLRDLSQRTQVVIITHNRATMEYADYLYGLTMEKPRESKIISARLADLEKISSLEEQN
ncbi:MAG: chromosome segregation protein SMC [candidate division WOR-3 bacterium]|nr:MAG: chromosome segregation protein SMC [candidate division WOR-3 bacterium]